MELRRARAVDVVVGKQRALRVLMLLGDVDEIRGDYPAHPGPARQRLGTAGNAPSFVIWLPLAPASSARHISVYLQCLCPPRLVLRSLFSQLLFPWMIMSPATRSPSYPVPVLALADLARPQTSSPPSPSPPSPANGRRVRRACLEAAACASPFRKAPAIRSALSSAMHDAAAA